MDERPRKLYDALVNDGYKLPDYDTFYSGLTDKARAEEFHGTLSSQGYKLPDFDTFYSSFQPVEGTEIQSIEQPQSTLSATANLMTPRVGGDIQESEELNPIMSFLNIFSSRIANTPADLMEGWAIASAFTERQLNKIGVPFANKDVKASDIGAYKVANDWRNWIDEVYPTREGDRETFGGQVVDGLGQIVPLVLTGGKSGATTLAKTALQSGNTLTPFISAGRDIVGRFGTTQGLIAGSQIAAPSYKEAIESGATEDEALQYAIENFAVGSVIETLPVQSMFSRLRKLEPNAKILDIVKNGLVGASEEAVTEMWQETYANMSAQRIYDFNRELLDGIGEAGAVGGTVGFLLNTMTSALTGRRGRVQGQEKSILDKSLQELAGKTEQVETSNTELAETVGELENMTSRTLTDGTREMPFVETTDGRVEHVEDGMSKQEAEATAMTLSQRYDRVTFTPVNNTNPSDPYAEPDYTVVGEPKVDEIFTDPVYTQGERELTKAQTQLLINGAETVADLEGIQIENDPELESALQQKFESLNPETNEQVTESTDVQEQPTEPEPTEEEPVVVEDVQQEPASEGTDTEVQVDDTPVVEETQETPVEEEVSSEFENEIDETIPENEQDVSDPDSAFDLFENEGEWKATTTSYKGRTVGNVVYSFLDKKSKRKYDKLRNEMDGVFGTKEEAQKKLEQIQRFEQENSEAFNKAKKAIDDLENNKNAQPVTEEITPTDAPADPGTTETDQPTTEADQISFSVFGEQKFGTRDGEVIVGEDGTRYQPTMVSDVRPMTDIEKQKSVVRQKAKGIVDKLKEDKQGIIVDFEQKAKDDIEFYKSIGDLITEYARLKGMQFNEFVKELEALIGNKVNKADRAYLKGRWDETKKEIPKVNVMTENKGLTEKEKAQQGLAEILDFKEKQAKERLEAEKRDSRRKIREAKDKEKAKLTEFKRIKQVMTDFLVADLQDLPSSNFTKSEVQRVIKQINDARTDFSLNKAIDRAYEIFGEAGNRQRMATLKSKSKTASKNVKAGKLGVVPSGGSLDQMLKIDPKIIPTEALNDYESVLSEIGERKTVINPSEKSELMNRVNNIMTQVDNTNSRVSELADLFDSTEKRIKDKKVSYSGTVADMLSRGEITEADAELMKQRKSDIVEDTTTEKTEAELEAEKQEAIKDTLSAKVPEPSREFSQDENKLIRFFRTIKGSDLDQLTTREIKWVGDVMSNMENNYVPHMAEVMRQKIEANRDIDAIRPVISQYKGKLFDIVSKTKAGVKNIFSPGSTSQAKEKIRRNPLSYIDQVIGNFKDTVFYENTFHKLAVAYEGFNQEHSTIMEKLRRAEAKIPTKDQFKSRAKLMMIALQREFESNPGQKVHSAKEWLESTINDRNSIYTKESKVALQEVLDSNSTDGEFDIKKAEKSLTTAEREAMDLITEINKDLTPKADFTATVIRGKRVPLYDNYIHVPLAVKGGRQNELDVRNPMLTRPSTSAGTLTERTGKAHAISFDIFDNVLSGAKQTLMDYNMTPVIKEMNQVFSKLERTAETDNEIELATALNDVYREVYENVIGVNMSNNKIGDKIFNEVVRKGYQATLSGIGRSISEFGSNAMFAMSFRPTETMEGIGMIRKLDNVTLSSVVKNVGSTQASRLYGVVGMDSKHLDFSKMKVSEVSKVTGYDEGVLTRMFKAITSNPAYRFVDEVQAFTLSKPDQIIARPMWFGSFAKEFEGITGKKPNLQKIADNDFDYMEANRDAIKSASKQADNIMVEAVSSSNPFDGILRNQVNPSSNWAVTYYKTFNSFMTRFPTYEYNSAVRAIESLRGNGMMSRSDASRLILAVNARLFAYSLMTGTMLNMVYRGLTELLGYDIPEEESDDDVAQVLSKEFFSALSMLSINRNIGNVAKIPINLALEYSNKEFGEGVTYDGDYDPFEDNIVYPLVPVELTPGSKPIAQGVIENTAGPLSPAMRSMFRTSTALHRLWTSKKPETKQKYIEELLTRTPFEVAGNLGYIPFYKDMRQIMLKAMYEAQKGAEKEAEDNDLQVDWR